MSQDEFSVVHIPPQCVGDFEAERPLLESFFSVEIVNSNDYPHSLKVNVCGQKKEVENALKVIQSMLYPVHIEVICPWSKTFHLSDSALWMIMIKNGVYCKYDSDERKLVIKGTDKPSFASAVSIFSSMSESTVSELENSDILNDSINTHLMKQLEESSARDCLDYSSNVKLALLRSLHVSHNNGNISDDIECIEISDDDDTSSSSNDSVIFIEEISSNASRCIRKRLNSADNNEERLQMLDECYNEMCKESFRTGLVQKKRQKRMIQKTFRKQTFPYDSSAYSRLERSPRCIVIDGSNVAREHGSIDNSFSCAGIRIAVDFFKQLGHPVVKVFVPKYVREKENNKIVVKNKDILDDLRQENHLVYTPSMEQPNGALIVPYDDRFILEYAASEGAVVVSNDRYRDLVHENPRFNKVISNRLLMFAFADDFFLVPTDPKGFYGPNLLEFLSVPLYERRNCCKVRTPTRRYNRRLKRRRLLKSRKLRRRKRKLLKRRRKYRNQM